MSISKQIWEQVKEQALENNKQLDSVQILTNVYKEIYSHFDLNDENNSQEDEDEKYNDYCPDPDSAYEDRFEDLDGDYDNDFSEDLDY